MNLDINSFIGPRDYVCLCKSVSRKDIRKAFEEGHKTLSSIQKKTLATTGCGTCINEVSEILQEFRNLEEKKELQKVLPFE